MKYFSILAACLLINGCSSTAISKKSEFNESSKTGLIIVGVESSASIHLDLAKFDEVKNKLEVGVIDRGGLIIHEGSAEKKYYILDLKPGTYLFRQITEYSTNQINSTCLIKGTYKFDVIAGKSVYVGNIYYNPRSNISVEKGDISKANIFLQGYPNIITKIEQALLSPTKFDHVAISYPLSYSSECGAFF